MDTKATLEQADRLFGEDQYKAVEFLEESCVRAREENDYATELACANDLIGWYRGRSKFGEAWGHANRCLQILDAHDLFDTVAGATTFLNIANIFRYEGKPDEALDVYGQVLRIYDGQGIDGDRLAAVYNNMMVCFLDMKNPAEAESCGMHALEALDKYPELYMERGVTLSNLANIQLQKEPADIPKAAMYSHDAVNVFKEHCPEDGHYFAAVGTLAYFTYLLQEYDESIALYEEALEGTLKVFGESNEFRKLLSTVLTICRTSARYEKEKELRNKYVTTHHDL